MDTTLQENIDKHETTSEAHVNDTPNGNLHVEGNYISGPTEVQASQVAFRDINHHTYHHHSRAEFARLSLKTDQDYLEPVFTARLVDQVLQYRLLMISGGPGFDKGRFIRHLAGKVKSGHSLTVKELRENSESDGLIQSVSQHHEQVIFLLPGIHPRQIGYDIEKLLQVARQQGHYIIMTTDIPVTHWALNPSIADDLWFDVPEKFIYSPEQLTNYLRTGLHRLTDQLRWLRISSEPDTHTTLSANRTVGDISSAFDRPEEIDLFLHMLVKLSEQPTDEKLDQLVTDVADTSEALIAKWFKTLNMSQQLIALAATMMEGMYDDQFFGIMKEAVLGFWEYRDPTLRCLDYCDLEFLLLFFEFEEIHEEKRLLRSRFSGQRTHLIRAAWKTHRRHILDMLPRFMKLVMHTVSYDDFDFERFGTRDRRMVLRQTISKTLSDLGLIHLPSVESSLMELSATSNPTISRVASKALARWRELGKDELLFATLDRWQDDGDIKALIQQLVDSKRLGHHNQREYDGRAIEYIRASTVKVMGYAAEYDRPNQLHQKIIDQLISLANDPYPKVKEAIKQALPRFIHHHIFQLRAILTDHILKIDELDEPIAEGLKLAYADHPKDLVQTVEFWLEEIREDTSKLNRRQKMTYRDKVLATILAFWAKIDYGVDHQDGFGRYEVVDTLNELYKQEGRVEMQRRILQTALTLLSQDWRLSGKYVLTFFPPMEPDLSALTSALLDSYINERRQLSGGDCVVYINGEAFNAWFDPSQRKHTMVEQMLYHWLERGDNDIRKLGALGLAVLVNCFDLNERSKVAAYVTELEAIAAAGPRNSVPSDSRIHSNSKDVPQEFPTRQQLPPIDRSTDKYILRIMKRQPQSLQNEVRMFYRYFQYRQTTNKDILRFLFAGWATREDKTTRDLGFYLNKIMVEPRPEGPSLIKQIMVGILIFFVFLWLMTTCA